MKCQAENHNQEQLDLLPIDRGEVNLHAAFDSGFGVGVLVRLVEATQGADKDISAFEYIGGGGSVDDNGLSSFSNEGFRAVRVGVASSKLDAGDLLWEIGWVKEGSCDGNTF